MAENLIFPIGFDLEKAVNEAGQQWDKNYAKKLEDYMAKRPVCVKLDFDKLEDVKKRLAQLKIEPITPETKTAIKELARELQVLAKALEQVQKYSNRSVGTAEVRGARVDEIEAKAAAARELARQRAVKAEQAEIKLAEARERSANAANKAATGVRDLTNAYKEQSTYLDRLIKRMVTYWSVQQVQTFLTNIREVTAQFELQRVSLGAIIQDQARANQLFSEIKTFALKSPISIMDLTKYTKQVAAYGIETEKLFGTTKMLADISVGLGVSLDRLSLFYGQVFATGHLRASEVRQATEAGIPLVDKLAQKLSETNGKLVSAAEVMDLISKRAISFELVEEVFKDMTSAGGMFFEMQEKQGNTLFGMWAKLGDAASVMYDQIGNTKVVNEGMKAAIEALTEFMRNWKSSVAQMGVVAGALGLRKLTTAIKGWQSTIVSERLAANARLTSAQNAYNASLAAEAAAIKANTDVTNHNANAKAAQATATRISAKASLEAAFAESRAAAATTLWSKAWNKLKAAFMGNWITLLLTALAALVTHFLMAEDAAARLKNTLADIGAESERETAEAVGKFKILADRAVEAADGSKAQRDALEELKNTYGNIIPYEYLTLENLRKMKGEYGELTTMIEEYNAKLKLTNSQNAIEEEYAPKEKERRTKLRKKLTEDGFELDTGKDVFVQEIKFNPVTIQKFFSELNEISKTVTDKSEAIRQAVQTIWADLGIEDEYFEDVVNAMINFDRHELEGQGTMMDYAEALIEKNQLLQQEQDNYDKAAESLNKYTTIVDNLKKSIEDKGKESFSDDESYDNYLENEKQKIQDVYGAIVEVMNNENAEVITAYNGLIAQLNNGTITYTNLLEQLLDLPLSAKGHSAVSQIQQIYAQLAPTDETVIVARNKFASLANSMEISMFAVQRSQMKQGETLKDHRKTIVSEIDTINEKILELMYRKTQLAAQGYSTKDVEDELANQQKLLGFYNAYLATLPKFEKETDKSRGTKSDNRLQNLQEIERTLTSINKKYEELAKTEGNTAALEYVRKNYDSTLKYINKLGEQFNLNFAMPTDFKDLQSYRKAIQGVIEQLKMKGYEKAAIELELKIAEGNQAQLQKEIQAKLKALADRISRTKTAKEFYEKILSQTGDVELATRVSLSIYGSTGEELFKDTVAQIREVFKSGKEDVVIDLEPVFDMTNQRIDYKMLADIYEKYQNDIIDKNRDTAQKIAQEGQKATASNIANWQKELAKAKDFEQQRTDIIRTAAAEREKIIKEVRDPEERERLLNLSREKESQDLSKLNFEEFTKSEDYIKIFENLDNTATSTLKRLRTELQALIDTNKDLSPENMKTLVKAMEDIDEQISGRGFGNDMVQSVNDYIASIKNLKIAKQELAKAEAEYEAQEPRLDADIETAKAEKESADADVVAAQQELLDIQTQMAALREQEIIDETQLAALQAQEVAASNALTAAERKQNQAATAVFMAEQAKAKAADKVKKAEQKVSGEHDKQKKATTKFFKDLQQVAATADQLASVLGDVQEALGISEDSAAGLVFDSAIQGLQEFSKIMNVIIGLQTLYNIVTEANPWMAIAAAVLAVGSILGSWISGSKVRKANKEIERQQELLDQLEYTYGRLENAADKLFGRDYLNNYNQQLKVLQAQQAAYLKQAEAERSKGKKEDKEKTKEYLENARDVADQIKELQDDLVAHFTGSSRTDVARQMAKSWVDARVSMSDTFAAIKSDYSDMIKNMIVEGAAARVIENALTPVWDNMEKMLANNDIDGAIDSLVNGMDAALTQANNGMEVLWKALEARGYDMKQLIGDVDSEYTGIAKNIAGATSEEINTAAAIGNTIMYHTSHIPIISQNVAAMYQLMSQGKTAAIDSGSTGWTDWQQQAMDNYNAIARNTADTVVRCERAAVACEAMAEKMGRAFRAKGATSGFNVFLNS